MAATLLPSPKIFYLASALLVAGTATWLLARPPRVPAGGARSADAPSCPVEVPAVAPIRAAGSVPYPPPAPFPHGVRRPRLDTSAAGMVWSWDWPWSRRATLREIADVWEEGLRRGVASVDGTLARRGTPPSERINAYVSKAAFQNFEGEARAAYASLEQARALAHSDPQAEASWLYTIVYYQGVTAFRCGENDNCVGCPCRTDCSCILPIAPAAVHVHPEGSRLAIAHFREYLEAFPDDLEVRWLLNLAYMTLGQHPAEVDPRYLLSIEAYTRSEFDIGRFTDVGRAVGLDRLNESGGAIMDDFDGDGLLDVAVTCIAPTQHMALYRNAGDGSFQEWTVAAGLADQLGGLNCVQTDYDNDGRLDIYIPRGAWFQTPMRPSLLRNAGAEGFVDVTEAAGLLDPVNSGSAQWADFDNDGRLDLFVACERQANRLFHNLGDGTFQDVARRAGVRGSGAWSKGCAWIDYDNDRFPDLFVSSLDAPGQLFHNDRDGTFTDVTGAMGVGGAQVGFSCWAWDYDNDGWLDLFASCYARTLSDVVRGLIGEPAVGSHFDKLFHNEGGRGFKDVSKGAGLEVVHATMGSNFADFDEDGYLDMYLATGDPALSTLIPNRMLRNVGGTRFADITASSGTGHLQKGHGVACGDWDRDGDVDLFVQLGGAVRGDRFHNAMFENPGQGNHSLTVRLTGKKTNRPAIGARIKAITAGGAPLTVQRHVSSGSSFGANPLEQTLGLGKARRVAVLEVFWPTSGTTQVFRDIDADQVIHITELDDTYEAIPLARLSPSK